MLDDIEIKETNRKKYVRMRDIPNFERSSFNLYLKGQGKPLTEDENGELADYSDFEEWKGKVKVM